MITGIIIHNILCGKSQSNFQVRPNLLSEPNNIFDCFKRWFTYIFQIKSIGSVTDQYRHAFRWGQCYWFQIIAALQSKSKQLIKQLEIK